MVEYVQAHNINNLSFPPFASGLNI
jgi:hypothetical protein